MRAKDVAVCNVTDIYIFLEVKEIQSLSRRKRRDRAMRTEEFRICRGIAVLLRGDYSAPNDDAGEF